MKTYWSKEEITQLKNLVYRGYTLDEIFSIFKDHTQARVSLKIKHLSLTSLQQYNEKFLNNILALNKEGKNITQIANALNSSVQIVTNKLYNYNQKQQKMNNNNKKWSKDDKELVVELVDNTKKSFKQVAKIMGRSRSAVYGQYRLNKSKVSKKVWTSSDDAELEKLTKSGKSTKEISAITGRTFSAITSRRNRRKITPVTNNHLAFKTENISSMSVVNSTPMDNMKIIQQILDSGKKAIIIL